MNHLKPLCTALVAALSLGISAHAIAQANSAEVAVGGGLASFHEDNSSTNKGKFDASVSYNATKEFSIGFEYGYTSLGSASSSSGGFNINASGSLQNYGAVFHAGLNHIAKLQPYLLVAGGGERASASASAVGNGYTISETETETGGYIAFGLGLNARIGGGFGVRPEFRYQRDSVGGNGLNELDFTGTLFYTFGGKHKRR